MANYLTTDTELTSIANAIRTKGDTLAPLVYPDGFVSAIDAISTGTDTSDANATAADILSGKTAYVNGVKITGNITSKSAQTYTPTTANQTIAAGKYLTGAQTIAGDSNLVAENIAEGVSIFGVTGTHSGGGGGAQIEVHPHDYGNSMSNDGYYTGFTSDELPTIIWGYQKKGNYYNILLIINNKQNGQITCIRESGDRSSTTNLELFEDPDFAGSYKLNYWDSSFSPDCDFDNIYSIM